MCLIVSIQNEMISSLLIVHKHSLVFLYPSAVFNLITLFLQWIWSLLFIVLKRSSVGANWGLYLSKSIIMQLQEFIYSIHSLEVWIGELFKSNNNMSGSTSRFSFIHLVRFSKCCTNILAQLFWFKFVKYQSHRFVIASINYIDLLKLMFQQ